MLTAAFADSIHCSTFTVLLSQRNLVRSSMFASSSKRVGRQSPAQRWTDPAAGGAHPCCNPASAIRLKYEGNTMMHNMVVIHRVCDRQHNSHRCVPSSSRTHAPLRVISLTTSSARRYETGTGGEWSRSASVSSSQLSAEKVGAAASSGAGPTPSALDPAAR